MTLTGLVDLEDALDPGDDLVGGRVRGLVKVDDSVALELDEGASCGRPSAGQRGEVRGLHVQLVEVLSLNNEGLTYYYSSYVGPGRERYACVRAHTFIKRVLTYPSIMFLRREYFRY